MLLFRLKDKHKSDLKKENKSLGRINFICLRNDESEKQMKFPTHKRDNVEAQKVFNLFDHSLLVAN